MRRHVFFLASFVGMAALGTLCGCSKPSKTRQEITGEVTLKGQPVEDGIINFAPLDGQETGDGAQIVKGKYRIPKEKGLFPGRYKVTIYAGNGASGEGDASPDPPKDGPRPPRDRIPPEYNTDSNVVKEVIQGGENKFDFNIP
jgi:hypothetical protein